MKLRLRTIIITIVVLFILLLISRVTGIYKPLFHFISKYGNYVILFIVLLGAGILVFFVTKRRKINEDLSSKCFQYLNKWWCDTMGINEELKLEDGLIKEGWYSSQKFYGFNVTKKNSNERFIGIVGVSPMRVAFCLNRPGIKEDADPFLYFFRESEPKPTADYEDYKFKQPFGYESRLPRPKRQKRTIIEGENLGDVEFIDDDASPRRKRL